MLLSLPAKIKRRLITGLKLKLISWLARNLEAHKRGYIHASLASTAQIAPEAEIQNPIGDCNRIVVGEHSFIRGKLLTFAQGGTIEIGSYCYVGHRTEIWSMDLVSIGNRVLIAHDVKITDNTAHSLDAKERHKHYKDIIEKGHPESWEDLQGISASPIVIEDDVWISFGVTILKGVRIGAGSVIAANSFVTKDVPPGTLYRCEIKPIMRPLALEERPAEFAL